MPANQGQMIMERIRSIEMAADWVPSRRIVSRHPPVIANGLPKAGTNLLVKALVGIADLRRSRWAITQQILMGLDHGRTLPVGVDHPREVSVAEFRRRARLVAPGCVVSAHLPDSEAAREVLGALSYRMTVIVRDPRDVAVSLARYVTSLPTHPLHQRFTAADPAQRLRWAIEGMPGGLDDLATRMRRITEWSSWQAVVVRFEDLIGPAGGGDADRQADSLRRLARHVGVEVTAGKAAKVGHDLFGGTRTFRSGRIGGWREHLGTEHVTAIKQILGDLLVELGYERDDSW